MKCLYQLKSYPVQKFREKNLEMLNPVGNVPLGQHQSLALNANDPLIRTAASGRRQFLRHVGHIYANEGKVTINEFKDVGATTATNGLRSILMRVGPKPAKKHGLCIHAARQSRKREQNARKNTVHIR
jgi:hypothetical protein